jgi:hypothetical protein
VARGDDPRMLQDGQLICDACRKVITKITAAPAEGWEKMHNLCSACFVDLWKQSIPPA